MASDQNYIEVEHIGRLLLPNWPRSLGVQRSKDDLKRCLMQIMEIHWNRRLEEGNEDVKQSITVRAESMRQPAQVEMERLMDRS